MLWKHAAGLLAALALGPSAARAQQFKAGSKPTIVLVHGAFADASGWSEVIQRLQQRGYAVVAVQNPLSSLATDVATTKRVIDAQPGNVIVVGHSYGGAVISGAAARNRNVKALVYIAAFAPDANEPLAAISSKFPPSDLVQALVTDAAGFAYIDSARFRGAFAADLPERQTRVMAATQKPFFAGIFSQANPDAAWRGIPTWYLVAKDDRAINPDVERFYAKRMGARTQEVTASHVPFLSRPDVVVQMILSAAGASER